MLIEQNDASQQGAIEPDPTQHIHQKLSTSGAFKISQEVLISGQI